MIPVEYGVRFRVFTDRSKGDQYYGMLMPGQQDYHGGERVIRQNGVERVAEQTGLTFRWGTRYHPGANSFAWIYPWSDMLRVNLAVDGTEAAVEGDEDFTIDGSNGDVMVRLPLYYYSTEIDDEAGTLTFWVCQYKLTDAYQADPLHLRPDGTVNRGWEYVAAFYSRFESAHSSNTLAAAAFTPIDSAQAGNGRKYAGFIQSCSARKGAGWRAFDWRALAYVWRLNVIQNARLDSYGGCLQQYPWTAGSYDVAGTDLPRYAMAAEDVLSPRSDRRIACGNNFGHSLGLLKLPGDSTSRDLSGQTIQQNITGLFSSRGSTDTFFIAGLWMHNGSYYLEMDPGQYVQAWPANCLTENVPDYFAWIGSAPASGVIPANVDWAGAMSPLMLPRGAGGYAGSFTRGTTDSVWYGARTDRGPLCLGLDVNEGTLNYSFLLFSPASLDGPGTPAGTEITLISRDPAAGETITSNQPITYVLGATPEPRLYDESNANALIYAGSTDGWGPGYSGERSTNGDGHIVLTVRRDDGWLTGRCSIWLQADD